MAATPEQRARLVIALERADTLALEIVSCMLGNSFRALHGLFIEDARLLEHARSRLAREVLLSGTERPLEAAALAEQLRAQAELVKRGVEASASKLGLPFSFQIARGELLEEAARVAAQADSIAVSLDPESRTTLESWIRVVGELAKSPLRMLLLARRGWLTGSGILVVAEDEPSAASVMALADQLAAKSRSPLAVLVRHGEAAPDEATGLAALPRERRETRRLRFVANLDPERIAAAAYEERARLVLLPWRDRPEHAELVRQLMQHAASAILLVK
jgi:hypothetical protein